MSPANSLVIGIVATRRPPTHFLLWRPWVEERSVHLHLVCFQSWKDMKDRGGFRRGGTSEGVWGRSNYIQPNRINQVYDRNQH